MIACLSGVVKEIGSSFVVLMVNGIGFLVNVPGRYDLSVGKLVDFFVYSHYSADAGMQLFGFLSCQEKLVFDLLLCCSGVGPKMALAILARFLPKDFMDIVLRKDFRLLSEVSGIGSKKAESIIFQLKDKILNVPILSHDDNLGRNIAGNTIKQVEGALDVLGYRRHEIARALSYLTDKFSKDLESTAVEILVRQALNFLSGRH